MVLALVADGGIKCDLQTGDVAGFAEKITFADLVAGAAAGSGLWSKVQTVSS
jgi:hypothetical protein